MNIPILTDIITILGFSVAVIFIFSKLKLPPILGFLLTGTLIGPNFFSLINNVHEVELMAEIGIVLLLFTIGLEFSLKELANIKKAVFIGGGIQVVLTIALVAFFAVNIGLTMAQSIFFGFLISLSSTAIVLKLLQESGEIDSHHGKTILGILIFQDIIVVPMMLFTPLLSGNSQNIFLELLILLFKGVCVVAGVYIAAKYLMPRLLFQVARTNNSELFLLSIIVICFAVAWITSSIGLSLALGAFLAGIIISESEYSHQAISYVIPFREIFESFFFVSIGMLLNVRFLADNIILVVLLTAGVIILKTFVSAIAGFSLKLPMRTVMLTSLAICQVGEFAFILSKFGLTENIITGDLYQYFLSVSILTMAFTPFVIKSSHYISDAVAKVTSHPKVKKYLYRNVKELTPSEKKTYKNHLVIIGYGFNGRTVAKAARYAVIPYLIIDINADRVKRELKRDENIFYGDAVYDGILKHVCVENARVVVVGISDPVSTRRIISNIRSLSDSVYMIVRTKYIQEIEELKKLGANEVVAEEFEASIEIFTRVLSKYLIPQDDIEQFIKLIRSDGYEMLRPVTGKEDVTGDIRFNLSEVDISSARLRSGCSIIGVKLSDADLRNQFGITLLAIRREKEFLNNPDADTVLNENDVLYIFGEPDKISSFTKYIRKKI